MLGASMALASGTESALLFETLRPLDEKMKSKIKRSGRGDFPFLQQLFLLWAEGLWPMVITYRFFTQRCWHKPCIDCGFSIKPPAPAVSAGSNNKRSGTKLRFFDTLTIGFRHPALRWFLGFGTLAYMFSHVGFVFGQPFIFEALGSDQTQSFAVIVSGSVSAAMMGVSLLASAVSKRLRQRLGLAGILLFAFGIQISINGVLAIENSIYLSAVLLLGWYRMHFPAPISCSCAATLGQ